jgi:hypothetical protein
MSARPSAGRDGRNFAFSTASMERKRMAGRSPSGRVFQGLESEIGTLRKTRDEALTKADKNDAALTGALSGLATRMEALAEKLAVRKH